MKPGTGKRVARGVGDTVTGREAAPEKLIELAGQFNNQFMAIQLATNEILK
jgi:hypothetical protein